MVMFRVVAYARKRLPKLDAAGSRSMWGQEAVHGQSGGCSYVLSLLVGGTGKTPPVLRLD